MKILKFETQDEWLDGRRGKITGTKAGKLFSKRDKKPLKGYYELIAERVAIPASGENVMDRGHRLEIDGVVRFEKETGKSTNKDLVIMCRDENDSIAYSPDAFIEGKKGIITEDVEVKCLNSASHIEAWLTKKVPSEYEDQIIQGFVVNDKLETRYMVFYDPRMPIDFFYLTITRKEVEEQVGNFLEMERKVLLEISEIEKELTF